VLVVDRRNHDFLSWGNM